MGSRRSGRWPKWASDPEDRAQILSRSDEEVAEALGVSALSVARVRARMSEQPLPEQYEPQAAAKAEEQAKRRDNAMHRKPPAWLTEDVIAMMGTKTDREISDIVGRNHTAVARQRRVLGIAPSSGRPTRAMKIPSWVFPMLGVESDQEIARKASVSPLTVAVWRRSRGVPSRQWTKAQEKTRLLIALNRKKGATMTRTQAARVVGIPQHVADTLSARLGLKWKRKFHRRMARDYLRESAMLALHECGFDYGAIAQVIARSKAEPLTRQLVEQVINRVNGKTAIEKEEA